MPRSLTIAVMTSPFLVPSPIGSGVKRPCGKQQFERFDQIEGVPTCFREEPLPNTLQRRRLAPVCHDGSQTCLPLHPGFVVPGSGAGLPYPELRADLAAVGSKAQSVPGLLATRQDQGSSVVLLYARRAGAGSASPRSVKRRAR